MVFTTNPTFWVVRWFLACFDLVLSPVLSVSLSLSFSLSFSLSLSLPATLYTSCILVGIFINSSVPIFFELFIETVYPVPEGITCGVVTFLGNLVTGLLLFFLTFYCTGTLGWARQS